MDRKKFLKLAGSSCLAITGIPTLLTGCSSVHRVNAIVRENRLTVSKLEFIEGTEKPRDVVLVREMSLAFPIALYRLSTDDYIALWMECTHQGCEVNAQPHYLVCPCHGSEFDSKGNVVQGPAETNLKTFKISTDHENIVIHL
ncbi:ubiquinol-cytochrome c reductase iron-sulfur subunit [Flexithrix dorotheae]|uniref:QcrA and Rieske domain-containing protein n=1 Tax=Flexithrix dorotheae TaxID=70993 RepID=UPI000375020C|nr:Rieske 2Fe-2S domain-containing protein [Flexithrix dorotheae]